MNRTDHNVNKVEAAYHPLCHHASPRDVLSDAALSIDEKSMILSSWASDMYAVESQPALREVPGVPHILRLADILAVLKQLDEDTDPPPRGGRAMRLPRFSAIDCGFVDAVQRSSKSQAMKMRAGSRTVTHPHNRSRWSCEANIRRYRKLLSTQLTDIERDFIERRLAEELRSAGRQQVSKNRADLANPRSICG